MLGRDLKDNELRLFAGTARIVSPSETLDAIGEIYRKVGVTRVANITGLDSVGLPVWMGVRPLARSVTVSQGKGLTDDAAKVSAIMEAIEVFHAEHLLPPGENASVADVQCDSNFIPVADLPVRPGAELRSESVVTWINGICLISGETFWYPRQMIDLNTLDRHPNKNHFASSSNGLASGNSLAEAVLHAICEIIERDHTAFWTIDEQLNPYAGNRRIDLATVDDLGCRELLMLVENAGLECAVWNLTSNLNIPCFNCFVFDRYRNTSHPSRASGAGCHPLKSVAFLRAMTEALQSRLTFIAGSRDDVFWSAYRNTIPVDTFRSQLWLEECAESPGLVHFNEIPELTFSKWDADVVVGELVTAVASAGFGKVVVTDLTCDQIRVPVAYVFIPGMEPCLREGEYTPGRRMIAYLRELQRA